MGHADGRGSLLLVGAMVLLAALVAILALQAYLVLAPNGEAPYGSSAQR